MQIKVPKVIANVPMTVAEKPETRSSADFAKLSSFFNEWIKYLILPPASLLARR